MVTRPVMSAIEYALSAMYSRCRQFAVEAFVEAANRRVARFFRLRILLEASRRHLRHDRAVHPRHADLAQQLEFELPIRHFDAAEFLRRGAEQATVSDAALRSSGRSPPTLRCTCRRRVRAPESCRSGFFFMNSGALCSPLRMSTCTNGTVMPFSARKIRTRRGFGAPVISYSFISIAPEKWFEKYTRA